MKSLRRRRRACVESTHVRGGPVSTRIRNPTYSSQVKSSKIQRRSRIRILWGACRLENREGAARRNRAEPSARVQHGPTWCMEHGLCNEGLLIWIPSTHDTQKTELHRANVNVISVFTHLRFLTAALLEREVSAASAVTVVRNAPSLARMIAHPAFRIPNSPPLTAAPALFKAFTFPSRCCRLSRSISRLSQ